MRRVLLLLVLLMFVGAASATDYYVATWGDNSNNGLTLDTAWASIQYGFETMQAGDTLYIVNGTYHETPIGSYQACISGEGIVRQGNATHQFTLTAYNGTPIIERWRDDIDKGLQLEEDSYININGLRFDSVNNSYRWQHGIQTRYSDHINITNCTFDYGADGIEIYGKGSYTRIENCTVNNIYWNSISISNNGLEAETMHNVSVINCTINHTYDHNGIDLIDNLTDVRLIGNTITDVANAIFTHGNNDLDYHFDNFVLEDNNIIDCRLTGIYVAKVRNWTISNNTITDTPQAILPSGSNTTISDNTITNGTYIYVRGSDNMLISNLMIGNTQRRIGSGNAIIQNSRNTQMDVKAASQISDAEVLFTDGKVMTYNKWWDLYAGYYTTPVCYYPDKSNFSLGVTVDDKGVAVAVTTYSITLRPTYAYLCDVAVNHESDSSDDRTNIAVNSSVSTNPTWINATMQNASNTYNVSIDGVYTTQVVSDSDGVMRYKYSSSWSPHTFEFAWLSDTGFSGAPDPTNLANTTGETWVNHTWNAGSGNITDSYNVSVNSVWHNTSNTYYNDTGLSAESWSNITVWAFNNTGGISQNSISQNTQTNAAAWAPSNTAMYYNVSYTIEITTKTDGTNIFSRTPTEMDGNAISGRLVVKT